MNAQVKRLVTEVHDDWLDRIERATDGTIIKSAVMACMVPNEAGRFRSGPRAGKINPAASRLETGVFKKLEALRDRGYYTASGRRLASYNGVHQAHLAGASDEALENLASSWGVMQTMGYYILWLFKDPDGSPVTISELRDPDRHFGYAAELLLADAASRDDLRRLGSAIESANRAAIHRSFERVLRRWNSGSPTGKTYDPDYVARGLAYLDAWLELYGDERDEQGPRVDERAIATGVVAGDDIEVRPDGAEAEPVELAAAAVTDSAATGPQPAVDGAGGASVPVPQPPAPEQTEKVTSGSGSWARAVVGWITALFTAASGYAERAFGLDPSIQKWLLAGVAVLGVTWLVCKLVAERQVRQIHADPLLHNVK